MMPKIRTITYLHVGWPFSRTPRSLTPIGIRRRSYGFSMGGKCVDLFSSFVSGGPSADRPNPAEDWSDCPSFARAQWASAKKREENVEKSGQRKSETAIPQAVRDCLGILTWGICMDGPLLQAMMGGLMRALRSTMPNVVCFQEVTQRIWEILQRSRSLYSIGLRAATQLPPGCDYGALILTALPVLYAERTPLPSTSQGGIS